VPAPQQQGWQVPVSQNAAGSASNGLAATNNRLFPYKTASQFWDGGSAYGSSTRHRHTDPAHLPCDRVAQALLPVLGASGTGKSARAAGMKGR